MLALLDELRGRIVLAREASELGEHAMVTAVLRDLEETIGQAQAREIARAKRRVRRPRQICEECGTGFAWPGQLDEHRTRVHGEGTA